eukprot:1183518-Rhodomonas_salina.4
MSEALSRIVQRTRWTMSGTDAGYATTRMDDSVVRGCRVTLQMEHFPGDLAYLLRPCYAMSGTDIPHGRTRCEAEKLYDDRRDPGHLRYVHTIVLCHVRSASCLRACYLIPGTGRAYMALQSRYAVAGTQSTVLRSRYAMPGTDGAYGTTRRDSAGNLRT